MVDQPPEDGTEVLYPQRIVGCIFLYDIGCGGVRTFVECFAAWLSFSIHSEVLEDYTIRFLYIRNRYIVIVIKWYT